MRVAPLIGLAREFVRSLSSGAIHKTVYFPTVEKFWICAPLVEDQRRIADDVRSRLELAEAVKLSAGDELKVPFAVCDRGALRRFNVIVDGNAGCVRAERRSATIYRSEEGTLPGAWLQDS